METKKLTKSKIVKFFLSDFAKGIFTGMVANYLVYILQTNPDKSGLPILLPTDKFLGFLTVLSLITLFSKIIDAVSDPIVANWSDKTKNPRGRRIPFMQWSALPYGVFCVAIFFAPFAEQSIGNAVWVGICIALYFIFYTLYSIPQRALIPEIIPDAKERVGAYSISTVMFMSGSALAYTMEFLVSLIKKSGLSALWSWRLIFGIFGILGTTLLLISAFCIKEKDYLKNTNPPSESFFKSFKLVVKNKQFMIVTFADLFNYIAMAFFQTTMFIYMSDLLRLKEGQSMFVLVPAIGVAIIFFPIIIGVCKNKGKKTPLLIASAMFTVLFAVIFFGDSISTAVSPLVAGIGMGLAVAYPFAAINIIPQTIVADVIQEDCLRTGENREGMYSAAKTFLEKMAYAVAWLLVPIVLSIGSTPGVARTLLGVKITGPIAAFFSLISFVILLFYKEKTIMNSIAEKRKLAKDIEYGLVEDPKAIQALGTDKTNAE